MTDSAGLVVASVVVRDGRVLLGKRPKGKVHGGLWEFPGGKLKNGEDHYQAAKRELCEELALAVHAAGSPLASIEDPDSGLRIDFVPVQATGEPEQLEHKELAWVPWDEVTSYPLAPADQQFANDHVQALR